MEGQMGKQIRIEVRNGKRVAFYRSVNENGPVGLWFRMPLAEALKELG
jgi:hypothetical protein